jgi:hypothetical protein
MEVLKVKVDFKKPSSGSIPESPTLDNKRCEKNINNVFKEEIDQYIQNTRQVFQVWHNLCSELTSM